MEILKILRDYKDLDCVAMAHNEEKLSYAQLWQESEILGGYIKEKYGDDKRPVVVYGHKHPAMLIAFIACVKTGRAYVPLDTNIPENRLCAIIDSVQPHLILTTEELNICSKYSVLNILDRDYKNGTKIVEEDWVKAEDIYYIIFTSGSTGMPKGVQITYSALNYFTEWILSLGQVEKQNKIYVNQAPFSFDLSVMDLYMSLASGSCLFALDKQIQQDYKSLFCALRKSKANIWVSTPSFVDLCLADIGFSEELMPYLEMFLFCGETLTNKTAKKLLERFPNAEIFNTYGPTESTVAVTEILITEEVNDNWSPLPVGQVKPGTILKIMRDGEEVPEGDSGEIVIIGNTVSAGYFKNPEESEKSFFEYNYKGTFVRGYHTGDKGYIRNGMLFYEGRLDLQIKLHGYRMELEDVEENMMKIPGIEKAVVIPIFENDKVKYLKAFCVYRGKVESKRKAQKDIKSMMAEFVPDYMIPKKILFIDNIPVTNNGKADRKRLQEL